MIKKAFIFAAGRGERMGALTLETPKPLLPVQGKPLIEYTVERLQRAGVEQLVINLAHLGEKIEKHLGDGQRFGVQIIYSYEPYPLETGGALLRARSLLGDEPILMANADIWTDYPFNALLATQLQSGDVAHLVMVPNPPQHQSGDFALTDTNRLGLTKHCKPQGNISGIAATYSGIGIFSPELIVDYPHCREKFGLREVFEYFIQRNKIGAELYLGDWWDIGTPERLAEINQRVIRK